MVLNLWINELYVDEMFRKRGLAAEMLSYMENWATAKQIIYFACVTGEKNSSAQTLYKKSGFDLNTTMWVDKKI